jgi:allantoin racemase
VRIAVSWPVPERLVSTGFTTGVVSSKMTGVYPAATTPVDHALRELSFVEAAVRAEAAGFDAYFINSGGDYGLHLIRATVGIPAFGGIEPSVAMARVVGARFSIVTVWPDSTNYIYAGLNARYRCDDRCVSVRNVTTDTEIGRDGHGALVGALEAGDDGIVARIAAEMLRAVHEDGAASVILGCTCMSPVIDQLAERCPVPVIDPLAVGYRFAETTLRLGLHPGPHRGRLPQVVERERLGPLMDAACDLPGYFLDECGDACALLGLAELEPVR